MARPTTVAVFAAALLPLLACAAAAREAPRPAESADEVVAEAGDVKITRAELERREVNRLAPLRQQEYQILRQAVNDMLADRLLDKEAASRGLTREALLSEIDAKAEAPSPTEVMALFEQNKQRLPPGMTQEQAKTEIEQRLRTRNVSQVRSRFQRELLERGGARVRLEPPRSEVAVPAIAPAIGPEQAPVTIVEFSDYQCPYCQRAEATVQEVLTRYPGKIRLVHRDFPLDGHQRALPASRAVYCAGEQGKFWEYHRGIFLKPSDLSDDDLKRRATELALDAGGFAACYASNRHDETIRAAAGQGSSLGVTGTPTFFINGRMLVGSLPLDQFRTVIDEELARP